MELRTRRGSKMQYSGNREGLLALDPPHAAAVSTSIVRPMKSTFATLKNQVADHVDAVAAWEWRMLHSLALNTGALS